MKKNLNIAKRLVISFCATTALITISNAMENQI